MLVYGTGQGHGHAATRDIRAMQEVAVQMAQHLNAYTPSGFTPMCTHLPLSDGTEAQGSTDFAPKRDTLAELRQNGPRYYDALRALPLCRKSQIASLPCFSKWLKIWI